MTEIEDLQAKLRLQQESASVQLDEINELLGRLQAHARSADAAFAALLDENAAAIVEELDRADPVEARAWSGSNWDAWEPHILDESWQRLRVGSIVEDRTGSLLTPAWVPFVGGPGTTVITTSGDPAPGEALLQSLLMRAVLTLPHHCKLHLLDPSGGGRAFPMARHLPRVADSTSDLRRDLDVVTDQIRRIIGDYLDASTPSFDQLGEVMRLSEEFHLVFAADFPDRYDSRAVEALHLIAETGPTAGVYLFVHHHLDHPTPGDSSRYTFHGAHVVDLRETSTSIRGLRSKLVPDQAPDPELQDRILQRLRASRPREVAVGWDELLPEDPGQWWTETSVERIGVPIGTAGVASDLDVVFGVDRDGRPVVHGIVGAAAGGGKSTLFHTLITGLAVRYSPAELLLYLVDGKFGTEMACYRDLPHAEVVSLRTQPDMARSVLDELVEEMERRNEIFQDSGVADLTGYRRLGESMPRILLVVDEYQQFFEHDDDGVASALLLKLSQQGRSAGVHLLMGSQRFSVPTMRFRDAIFGNIHLRIAMQMMDEDIRSLSEFGPRGRAMINATCDKPGKVVVNVRGGDDSGNRAGRVALLDEDQRDQIVEQLAHRARGEGIRASGVVFNGAELPGLADDDLVRRLSTPTDWMEPSELQDVARRSVAEGGLGIDDWLRGEQPVFLGLGREFNVRGYTTAALRRRPGEAAVAVVPDGNARVGTLAAILLNAALAHDPKRLRVAILDHSVPGTEWEGLLGGEVADALRAGGFDVRAAHDDAASIQLVLELSEELEERRNAGGRPPESSWLVVCNDLDRVLSLNHIEELYGAEPTEDGLQLQRLFGSGPVAGIHPVVACQAVGSLFKILTRQAAGGTRYRISQQLSDDHSFELHQSNAGAKVMRPGDTLQAAVLVDNETGVAKRFMPHLAHTPSASAPDMVSEVHRLVRPVLESRGDRR